MPSAVLDLEITQLPPVLGGLDAYSQAFVLVRYKGQPVGTTWLPVVNGSINLDACYDQMFRAAHPAIEKAWLHHFLEPDGKAPLPAATVAICTRNRAQDLHRCLTALTQMPNYGHEILVVDNCPSDDATKQVVAQFAGVRYVLEERKGLDIARNRALQEAQNAIVAFTDDDAVPEPNWLPMLLRNFTHPLVLCVTGNTMPLELETHGQEAFEKYSSFNKGFHRKVHSITSGNPLATGGIGAGANMALRKDVLTLVGGFDEALDAGTPTQSGGDHEFFSRILLSGYQIVYEPQALSWHRHRRTWQETRQAIKGYGIGVYAFWTKLLLEHGELEVLKLPYGWFFHTQLPNIISTLLKRPNSQPFALIWAELVGCVAGPWKYFLAKRQLRKAQKA